MATIPLFSSGRRGSPPTFHSKTARLLCARGTSYINLTYKKFSYHITRARPLCL
jgi:hypothetical protein